MLTIRIVRKTGGGAHLSDYEYEAWINDFLITRGSVRRHRRSAGWRALLRRVARDPDRPAGRARGARSALFFLLAALTLASPATAAPGPVPQRSVVVPQKAAAPCLPGGVDPDVFAWPVTGAAKYVLPDGDKMAVIVHVMHERGSEKVALGYVGGVLVTLDADPDGDSAPLLNARRFSVEGSLIADKGPGSCSWFRLFLPK